METNNKVVYLTDYINKDKNVETIPRNNSQLDLANPKTHLLKRIVAFSIDLMTIGLIKTAIHGAYGLFVNQYLGVMPRSQRLDLINGNLVLHAVIFVAIYWSYFLYTTYVLDGKTLGKMTMGLRIINENFLQDFDQLDYKISLQNSLRRSMGYLICYLSFGTFFIFNFSSEDKRGLPDYLSASRTVSDNWLNQMLEKKQYSTEQVTIDIQALDKDQAA